MEGPNLAILEAHVAALGGDTVEFTLYGDRGTVRCEVAPTHDAMDRVIGTFCLALEVQDVDLRDDPVRQPRPDPRRHLRPPGAPATRGTTPRPRRPV